MEEEAEGARRCWVVGPFEKRELILCHLAWLRLTQQEVSFL